MRRFEWNRFSLISLPSILIAFALGTTAAGALERGPLSLDVLVRGVPLEEIAARGTTYIEAVEGGEYSLRMTNRSGRRLAVALSVDGMNTIDAKTTTAGAASKWILGPYQSLTIDGWQTGTDTARRFFFTTEERSYGAWLGKTSNLGMISAVVFREREPRPAPIVRPREYEGARPSAPADSDTGRLGSGASESPGKRDRSERRAQSKAAGESVAPEAELSDDLAATGIGRKVEHRVRRIRFEAESSPAAVIDLRYEYHDALVRLGVLPPVYSWREDPLSRRERARGFDDFEFAPDPSH